MDYDPSELVIIQCRHCGYASDNLEEFVKHKGRKHDVESWCRACNANTSKINAIAGYNFIVSICGDTCERCGKSYPPQVFDLHHLDPTQKEHSLSKMLTMNRERVKAERAKGVIVCANCHRLIHAEIRHGKKPWTGN